MEVAGRDGFPSGCRRDRVCIGSTVEPMWMYLQLCS